MEFLSNINFEAIVQLTLIAAIMIAGPVVIFLLAARGGDLKRQDCSIGGDVSLGELKRFLQV